jgi:hypothetical protein
MQSMKLIVWTGCATRWALVAVILSSGLIITAQEPDTSAQTNDALAAEVLSRLNEQSRSTQHPSLKRGREG